MTRPPPLRAAGATRRNSHRSSSAQTSESALEVDSSPNGMPASRWQIMCRGIIMSAPSGLVTSTATLSAATAATSWVTSQSAHLTESPGAA